jgi:hypothetical protein
MRVEEVFESVATSGGGAQMRSRDFLLLASQALCLVLVTHVDKMPRAHSTRRRPAQPLRPAFVAQSLSLSIPRYRRALYR